MKTSTSTNLTNALLGPVALAAVTSIGLRVREAFIVPTSVQRINTRSLGCMTGYFSCRIP